MTIRIFANSGKSGKYLLLVQPDVPNPSMIYTQIRWPAYIPVNDATYFKNCVTIHRYDFNTFVFQINYYE